MSSIDLKVKVMFSHDLLTFGLVFSLLIPDLGYFGFVVFAWWAHMLMWIQIMPTSDTN